MTPAKRDWRESLRKMQMPLEIFFGFAPVPLLMGAIITPDAWAMPLITLPFRLWLSMRPSPVKTMSAPSSISSKPTMSSTVEIPD